MISFTAHAVAVEPSKGSERNRPNIVVFLVDDLGIGDVGCFGNTTIKTPNIDQIAKDGVKLEHNLAPAALCTPSRAAFLTGRHAIRSGVVAEPGDTRVFVKTAIRGGLPPSEVTFAKLLQENGYRTGLIGKWHLGLSCDTARDFCHHPSKHGFDHFYGLPLTNLHECDGDWGVRFNNLDRNLGIIFTSIIALISTLYVRKCSLKIYMFAFVCLVWVLYSHIGAIARAVLFKWFSCIVMRNEDVIEQPVVLQNLTLRFATEAIHFIEENQHHPFLLYMSFAKVHFPMFTTEYFVNHSRHGPYGDNVEEMDWAVGKILEKIDRLDLKEDTFVYFTSDHGPALTEISRDGELIGGYQGIFRDGKETNFEGGVRVPTVVRWPGQIPASSRVTVPTSSLDVFPTILSIANIAIPDQLLLDGMDISKLLIGEEVEERDFRRFIFHYCDRSLQAVTYSDVEGPKVWKVHFSVSKVAEDTRGCYGNDVDYYDPPLVYELTSDPGESKQLGIDDHLVAKAVQETLKAIAAHNSTIKYAESQLSMQRLFISMQLCCNPPLCYCREEYPHNLITVP